jgi:hypothetical protein
MDKHGQSLRGVAERGFCNNCTILYGLTGVQFTDGSEATNVYVHHLLSLDISKKESRIIDRCPGGLTGGGLQSVRSVMGAGFIGQGDDNGNSPIYFTPTNGKYESGFRMGDNDRIMISADLVNYNEEAKDVYLTFDLEYLEGLHGNDASSELLSVGGCKLLSGPKVSKDGPITTKSPAFTILENGAIVSASKDPSSLLFPTN